MPSIEIGVSLTTFGEFMFGVQKARHYHDCPHSKEASLWNLKRCSVLSGLRETELSEFPFKANQTGVVCSRIHQEFWAGVVKVLFTLFSNLFFSSCRPPALKPTPLISA
tara:strand:- start:199 stop:525 length:327 start_codon:yes stop_codon:yes gene_type:complete